MTEYQDEFMWYGDDYWWTYIGEPLLERHRNEFLLTENPDLRGFFMARIDVWTSLHDKWDPWLIGERSYY